MSNMFFKHNNVINLYFLEYGLNLIGLGPYDQLNGKSCLKTISLTMATVNIFMFASISILRVMILIKFFNIEAIGMLTVI